MDSVQEEFKEDMTPLGIRTNDFFTLFTFDNTIKLCFLPVDKKYFIAKGANYNLEAIVAGCLYDELGEIYKYTFQQAEPQEVTIKKKKC